MTLHEFFYMGGKGFYVWGAYGMALLVFVVEVALVRNRRTQALKQVRLLRDAEGEE
ncbi:MAG TPA: heme exporter protein CcmD [Gallionellaceae bacterium]|nr:heme exporter protein CcmD [Gallionellaceae bacterium]